MNLFKSIRTYLLVCSMVILLPPLHVLAQQNSNTSGNQQATTAERDGQHDFDFLIGSWKVHLKRLLRPLTGSTEWVEFDGTSVCQKIWDGRANLNEFNVDSPEKHVHIQGLTLRLYNPESHQWSLYWANAAQGSLGQPPMVGQFSSGRGEFYAQENYEGRAIFVRYVWSDVTANSVQFEQSFSADGGKTWEPNWISTQLREKP